MFKLRDDAKKQLDIVDAKIEKAKTSLEKIEEVDEIKPLAMESVDIIPLGQIPEEEKNKTYHRDVHATSAVPSEE